MRLLDTRVMLRRLIAAAVVSASIASTVGAAAPAGQDPAAINDGRTGQNSASAPAQPGGRIDAGEPELRRQFKGLLAENADDYKRYFETLGQLKTEAEKKAYIAANWPLEKKVAGRMLELARRHPDDPASFDALAWLAILGYNAPQRPTRRPRCWPGDMARTSGSG